MRAAERQLASRMPRRMDASPLSAVTSLSPPKKQGRLRPASWAIALMLTLCSVGLAGSLSRREGDDLRALYAQATPHDAVTRLQREIDSDQVRLAYDEARGYLPAVLRALRIPVSSQVLVFSKTSIQKELISPEAPRALYFNDQAYVGYVP